MNFEQHRENMIEQQIRPWRVLDAAVLNSLRQVQRELFVPVAYQNLAFVDMQIPLQKGNASASMLAPREEARVLQDLALKKSDEVLEIGAGSGHMAALMASLCAQVTSVDTAPEMVHLAQANLAAAGVRNAQVLQADGANLPQALQQQRFDAILLSGALALVPQALLGLLKPGGRLCCFVGNATLMRATRVTRTGDSSYETQQDWDCAVPALHGFEAPASFRF